MSHTVVTLPYGNESVSLRIPHDKLVGVFAPRSLPPVPDPAASLRAALRSPVESASLREMASKASLVAVAIEDATRPVPNALVVDAVLSELEAGGVSPRQVKVIVATGLHRPLNEDERTRELGRWCGLVEVENHNATDAQQLVRLGTTSLGTAISINRSFMQADLRITTGDVEYHQFCGYGGGSKCVYPGLADADAIRANHSRMDLPGTGPGLLDGNPVRAEIDEVGRLAQVGFNLSLALNTDHEIVAVRAGHPQHSFREACRFVDQMYLVEIPTHADLVIASPGGHPKDIDIYQAQKAISQATRVAQPGGNVLVLARCPEGSGSKDFEAWMEAAFEANDIIKRINENFQMGGHKAYQIAREIRRAKIHLYSQFSPGRIRAWLMHPVRGIADMDRLIDAARTVTVLPQATLALARVTSANAQEPTSWNNTSEEKP